MPHTAKTIQARLFAVLLIAPLFSACSYTMNQNPFMEGVVQSAPLGDGKALAVGYKLPDDAAGCQLVNETSRNWAMAGVAGQLKFGGGRQVLQETGGCFVAPTLLDQVRPAMRVAREEIFGPVLSIIEYDTIDQAVEIANGTIYGLGAALWTRDISTAHRVARRLRAGVVYVNCFDADDITTPFGGYKQSGIGRDKSLHAVEKYTETKTIWIRL